MFHLNSKSDKRYNRQGNTILLPKGEQAPYRHTVHQQSSEPLPHSFFATPAVIHMSLGAMNIPSPASHLFPEISSILLFQTCNLLPSHLSSKPSIVHSSCSGLVLVKKLKPLECFCFSGGLAGLGNPCW